MTLMGIQRSAPNLFIRVLHLPVSSSGPQCKSQPRCNRRWSKLLDSDPAWLLLLHKGLHRISCPPNLHQIAIADLVHRPRWSCQKEPKGKCSKRGKLRLQSTRLKAKCKEPCCETFHPQVMMLCSSKKHACLLVH